MVELQTTLGTIFLTRLCVGNITEVGIPWFMQRRREKKETEGTSKPLSEVEKNFIQDEYHVMMGSFNDFAEMSIQVHISLAVNFWRCNYFIIILVWIRDHVCCGFPPCCYGFVCKQLH